MQQNVSNGSLSILPIKLCYIGVAKMPHSQRNRLTHNEANVMHLIFQAISPYQPSKTQSFYFCASFASFLLASHKTLNMNPITLSMGSDLVSRSRSMYGVCALTSRNFIRKRFQIFSNSFQVDNILQSDQSHREVVMLSMC